MKKKKIYKNFVKLKKKLSTDLQKLMQFKLEEQMKRKRELLEIENVNKYRIK